MFIVGVILSGCQTTKLLQTKHTSTYKTWSNVYLVEMANSIANGDFQAFAFYMTEYESELIHEHKRRLELTSNDGDVDEITRYGDIEHTYYVQTTMKMAEGRNDIAYFYINRYIEVMQNRFLYNQDWKPIPDYAK